MLFLIFTVLAGRKNFPRNFKANVYHDVTIPDGRELNPTMALSRIENGKSLNLISLSVITLCLNVSQISMKFVHVQVGIIVR